MCHILLYSVAVLVNTAIERDQSTMNKGGGMGVQLALLTRHLWGLDGGSLYRFTCVCAPVRMPAGAPGSGAGAGAAARTQLWVP